MATMRKIDHGHSAGIWLEADNVRVGLVAQDGIGTFLAFWDGDSSEPVAALIFDGSMFRIQVSRHDADPLIIPIPIRCILGTCRSAVSSVSIQAPPSQPGRINENDNPQG